MKLRVERDAAGFPRAIAEGEYAPMGRFLEQDVQSDAETCRDLLLRCEAASKRGETWEGTGNAHTVHIDATGVTIRSEYTDETCRLSLQELEEGLTAWLRLIG